MRPQWSWPRTYGAFLEGRPILARPVSPAVRLWRWSRRKPWVASFFLLLSLAVPGITWQAVRATLAEAATREERDHAERSRDRALRAVGMLLESGGEPMFTEEMRPYRKTLVAAGVRESRDLVAELEGDPRAESQRVEAYIALAKVQAENDERPAAIESARAAVSLAESLVARDPSSRRDLASLAFAHHQLAVVETDRVAIRKALLSSIELSEARLAMGGDDSHDADGMNILNYHNLGHCNFVEGRSDEAIKAFETG